MFFFGPEGMGKDGFGKTSGFAFELKEARRRLRDGEKPFFHNPLRIFYKDVKAEGENKSKGPELIKMISPGLLTRGLES